MSKSILQLYQKYSVQKALEDIPNIADMRRF